MASSSYTQTSISAFFPRATQIVNLKPFLVLELKGKLQGWISGFGRSTQNLNVHMVETKQHIIFEMSISSKKSITLWDNLENGFQTRLRKWGSKDVAHKLQSTGSKDKAPGHGLPRPRRLGSKEQALKTGLQRTGSQDRAPKMRLRGQGSLRPRSKAGAPKTGLRR